MRDEAEIVATLKENIPDPNQPDDKPDQPEKPATSTLTDNSLSSDGERLALLTEGT